MSFLKTLGATILGFFVSIFICFVLLFILIVVIASLSGPKEPNVSDNSVLVMTISGKLPNRLANNKILNFFSPQPRTTSLETLKSNLKKARADDHIKGVVLKINQVHEDWANLQAAYRAISQFRDSSSKFIYAAANDVGFNEKGYYLASAADSVFSPPQSFFEFDGFYTHVTFIKGLLDKLGIKTVIARHGKYKSAVEPLMRKTISPANKKQLQALLDETSQTFLKAVSRKSGQSISQLNKTLNEEPHLSVKFGYRHGMIDSLLYTNQLDSLINKRLKLGNDQHFNTISGRRYAQVSPESAGLQQPDPDGTIAVLYARGAIMNGSGHKTPFSQRHVITAPWFRKELDRITDNQKVKALVLRINSPGGSGSASNVIWHMIRQTSQKLPVVVSMGNVCASGGYYIASAADQIVAEPTTITGSIGVFSIHFNARELFNDKLAITFYDVKSNKHADWLSPVHEFTPSEKEAFKASVTQFYQGFLETVAKSRDMSVEQVDKIAQGRVWTGRDAKTHNLVDKLGGLQKALHVAAEKAGLAHYKVLKLPHPKGFIAQFFSRSKYQIQSSLSSIFGRNEQLKDIKRKFKLLQKQGALFLFPYQIKMQ